MGDLQVEGDRQLYPVEIQFATEGGLLLPADGVLVRLANPDPALLKDIYAASSQAHKVLGSTSGNGMPVFVELATRNNAIVLHVPDDVQMWMHVRSGGEMWATRLFETRDLISEPAAVVPVPVVWDTELHLWLRRQ